MSFFGSMRKNRTSSVPSNLSNISKAKDMDIYFVKQLAREAKELDLERKLDLELKLQEGTRKLLAACKHSLQSLEALKSLHTSNERIALYAKELQRRKIMKQANKISPQLYVPSNGKVAISDIRMPLIWKDVDHFKNRGDCRRFAVFCLLRVGSEIRDTEMITDVDRTTTDVAFEETLMFHDVPPDFEFRLEVFSHVLQEELSIANASNKLKKKISYSVSKAIGRRFSDNYKEDPNSKNSDFTLVARATLNLTDANPRIKTYDLDMECSNKSDSLPLFGHFCCRLAVQPKCMVDEAHSGYLNLVQQIGNITGSRRMLSSLKNFTLQMWSNFADVHSSNPDIVIPVKPGTKIVACELSYPRFSFKMVYSVEDEQKELLLAADSPAQLAEWTNAIRRHIKDYDTWKPASDSVMEIPTPQVSKSTQFSRHRYSSLYDETPFLEEEFESVRENEVPQRSRVSTPPFGSSSSSSTNSSLEYPSHPTIYRKSLSAYFSRP